MGQKNLETLIEDEGKVQHRRGLTDTQRTDSTDKGFTVRKEKVLAFDEHRRSFKDVLSGCTSKVLNPTAWLRREEI